MSEHCSKKGQEERRKRSENEGSKASTLAHFIGDHPGDCGLASLGGNEDKKCMYAVNCTAGSIIMLHENLKYSTTLALSRCLTETITDLLKEVDCYTFLWSVCFLHVLTT